MRHLTSWTQECSPDESLRFISDLALRHCSKAGEVGKVVAGLIASGDFVSLCKFDLDYASLTLAEALQCRQALAFFKKCQYIDLKIDKVKAAKEKFKLSERKCRETNEMFAAYDAGLFNFEPWVETAYRRAQSKISRVLGELPSISSLKLRFGPGATTLTKKKNASVVEKLQAGLACSEELVPYVSRILDELPHLIDQHWVYKRSDAEYDYGGVPVHIMDGDARFVLKDATIYRVIVVEPPVNTLVQLATGDEMGTRLKRNGIDIYDQSINKDWARIGSLTGDIVTLDLVDASGRIAIAVPRFLLPWEWYFFLSTMRTGKVNMAGEGTITLESFSSMGNGFTFPLETLIFWALASSASEDGFASVYGDDIIIRARDVQRVIRLLEISGFEVNKKKSFWTGPFRESCGGDYFSGIDIRPYYHKEVVSPMELFKMHNYYVRHLDTEMAELVLDQINPDLRIFGPDGYGDGHLVSEAGNHFIPRRHKHYLSRGYGGYLFDSYKLIGRSDERYGRPGDRILPLYTIYIRENAEEVLDPALFVEPSWEGLRSEDPKPFARRLRIYQRLGSTVASEPMRERKSPVDGVVRKCPTFPGTSGYKKISIYTFSVGR